NHVVWPGCQRSLEIVHRFSGPPCFGRNHPQVVPRLCMVGFQFDRFLQVGSRLLEVLAPQTKSAQIVVGLSLVGLRTDYLSEGIGGSIQIPVLKKSDAVGEVVALEITEVKGSGKGQCVLSALGCAKRDHAGIGCYTARIHATLIDLDDHVVAVDEKGGWNTEIPMAIEKIAESNVVNTQDFAGRA